MQPIYLDYNATTPVDPDVLEVMLPYFGTHFGNPSSKRHAYGWTADEAVSVAREHVAKLVNADPEWVRFTAGATEAINWAIKGYAHANRRRGKHIVTVATEHKAVLGSCETLEADGFEVTVLPVDDHGRVDPDEVAAAMRDDTILVCCMWANNELGAIQPVHEITEVAHAYGAAVLVDATQAVGKVPVEVRDIDLLACSAHKFYGPKGVGALVVNRTRRPRLVTLINGGGQEFGTRAGTLNVPGIVGMGEAARIASSHLDEEQKRMESMRDRMEAGFRDAGLRFRINGTDGPRLPNTCNVTFYGVETGQLVENLRDLAVSTGSACSTGAGGPSHVLAAIGSDLSSATLRLSLGRFTTAQDIEKATAQIVGAVTTLQPELEAR